MATITALENNLKEAKQQRHNEIKNLINSEGVKISIISDDFVSIKAETMEDIKKALNGIKPTEKGYNVETAQRYIDFIPNFYKLTIVNGYNRRELKIEFTAEGVKYWLTIDFKNLSEDFKMKYFREQKRHLYDTETVFVNIPAHFKKFKAITVQSFAFDFTYKYIKYYGGNIVLLDSEAINEIINFLKK